MRVDNPHLLGSRLPQLVPPDAERWRPAQQSGFMATLGAALQVENLLVSESDENSPTPLPRFWEELLVVADAPRSQYDALREAVAGGEPLPGHLACVALEGAGFHGQHGRRWAVLPGNLHLSAALVCDLPAAEFAPVLPALPAVATAQAITEASAGQLQPGIKWVNDVLLDGRKVAGSLTALRTFRGRITTVVVGIGLNVGQVPSLPDDPLALPATSLQHEAPSLTPSLENMLLAVLAHLAEQFQRLNTAGPAELLADYRQLSVLPGRRVAVWSDDGLADTPLATGEVVGIRPDLSLELRGQATPVRSGRLTFLA